MKGINDFYAPERRSSNGRYATWDRCDCCGKPVHPERDSERFTDYAVCGGDDDAGFLVCGRKRCISKRKGKTVPERYKLYAAQREKHAISGEGYGYIYRHTALRHGVLEWAIENCPNALQGE